MKFNLGILCEKRCEFSKAYEIYEEMIKKNPVFTGNISNPVPNISYKPPEFLQ